MAHLDLIDPEDAEGLLKEEYDAAVERAGKVFDIVRSMSLAPETLRASPELAARVRPAGLKRLTRAQL